MTTDNDEPLTSAERAELRKLRSDAEARRIEDIATAAAHKEVQTMREELDALRERMDARVPADGDGDGDGDDGDDDEEQPPDGREPDEPAAPQGDEPPARPHALYRRVGGKR